jgi:hypothetical protein
MGGGASKCCGMHRGSMPSCAALSYADSGSELTAEKLDSTALIVFFLLKCLSEK